MRYVAATLALVLLVGCEDHRARPTATGVVSATATPAAIETPFLAPGYTPPSPTPTPIALTRWASRTRVNVAEVDRLIDVLAAKDDVGLLALITPSQVACVNPRDTPPHLVATSCNPSEELGTNVPAFYQGPGQPFWYRLAAGDIERWRSATALGFARSTDGVYLALRARPGRLSASPVAERLFVAEYLVLVSHPADTFLVPSAPSASWFHLNGEGRVVGIGRRSLLDADRDLRDFADAYEVLLTTTP